MENFNPTELFTSKTKEFIVNADNSNPKTIDDIIRVQEATDKSQKIQSLLSSWSIQQAQERKLRKVYAICFIVFLSVQLVAMITFFLLIGFCVIVISEVQFSTFFISVLGEITALVITVTKYLFPQTIDSKILDILKDL